MYKVQNSINLFISINQQSTYYTAQLFNMDKGYSPIIKLLSKGLFLSVWRRTWYTVVIKA